MLVLVVVRNRLHVAMALIGRVLQVSRGPCKATKRACPRILGCDLGAWACPTCNAVVRNPQRTARTLYIYVYMCVYMKGPHQGSIYTSE